MTEPISTPTPPPPVVKQCQDSTSWQYGSSAVSAGINNWGVMHPVHGGHWAADAEVADWKVLA